MTKYKGTYLPDNEVDETARQDTIVAMGHKDHNRLFIRGQEVPL